MKDAKIKDYKDRNFNIRFLNSILTKTDGFVRHLDSQINILIGISSAIFIFSASQLKNKEFFIFFLIVSLFAATSSLISLLAIHPPKFLRKRNQEESLMYNKKVSSLKSANEYAKQLGYSMEDEKNITEQFAIEIYNLCKYCYRPKRELFNLSRNLLFTGLMISILGFFIEILYINLK